MSGPRPVETVSAGGIIVVTTTPPAPPESPPTPAGKCFNCGKECFETFGPLSHFTKDGFRIEDPCCRHGSIIVCPDCPGPLACPVCGCGEFYT